MLVAAPLDNAIFAGNRAIGRIALSVRAAEDGSRRQRVREQGALRVRFPNGQNSDTLDAVVVNTAGGMVGGDHFDIGVEVGAGARLTVTTAAAEKIYRSIGPDSEFAVKLAVGPRALLSWLPQETILFDRARLRRSIEIEVAREATLLLAEGIVFGRSAMGESMHDGLVLDRWRMRVGGTLALAESLRLDGEIADKLKLRAIAAGGVAVASVLKYPADDGRLAAVRALGDNFLGEVGVSAWNGLMLARLIAPDGAALRHDLVAVLGVLGEAPLPRLWLN